MEGAAIRKTCAQFVELCRRISRLRGGYVAIDGIRFKAVINRDKNFTKGKITSRLAHLSCTNRVMAEVPRRRLCSDSDAASLKSLVRGRS